VPWTFQETELINNVAINEHLNMLSSVMAVPQSLSNYLQYTHYIEFMIGINVRYDH